MHIKSIKTVTKFNGTSTKYIVIQSEFNWEMNEQSVVTESLFLLLSQFYYHSKKNLDNSEKYACLAPLFSLHLENHQYQLPLKDLEYFTLL